MQKNVPMWRVVAGRGAYAAADFVEGDYVAVGFSEVGNTLNLKSQSEMMDRFRVSYPGYTEKQLSVRSNMLWRFLYTVNVGDDIITYDPGTRFYHIGKIKSDVYWNDAGDDGLSNRRAVQWTSSIERDSLSQTAKYSLGAIQTIIKVPEAVAEEVLNIKSGAKPVDSAIVPTEAVDFEESIVIESAYADMEQRSIERIKDKIAKLDWEQMQELVAALLRAMGYRTSIAGRGPDRGRDVLATPDGFGFKAPRIIVEVKHRPSQAMGAPDVRAMPVGRQADDRGLFVSTGGFTREAYYEAEHGKVPISLVNLDDLTRAIIDNYPNFDEAGRTLLPLQKLYWPVE